MKLAESHFSSSWYYLEQEGSLAHSCLCNGLTALRNANLGDKKGNFYSAFFELSIGLERMLKLIVILDHMAMYNLTPPSEQELRGYGHDLAKLFVLTKEVAHRRCPSILSKFRADSLAVQLLHFLDRFAQSSGRYSNLNRLTGSMQRHAQDPLTHWGSIASQIVQTHATARERTKILRHGAIAHQSLDDVSSCLMGDLNQQSLRVGEMFAKAAELDVASKYAVFALVSLIESLREPLSHCTDAAQQVNLSLTSSIASIPFMTEFFTFAWADKTHTLEKRRWP